MNFGPEISTWGVKYLKDAVQNWYNREDRLKNLWFRYGMIREKKSRCVVLSLELQKWIMKARKMIYEREVEYIRQKIEAENTYVMLECPNFECRYGPDAVGVGIKYKDFEEGKAKCQKCGRPLELQEQRSIDNLIHGIR